MGLGLGYFDLGMGAMIGVWLAWVRQADRLPRFRSPSAASGIASNLGRLLFRSPDLLNLNACWIVPMVF